MQIDDFEDDAPHKRVSVLDLINFGYRFEIKTTTEGLELVKVTHCGKEMDLDAFSVQLMHLGIDVTQGYYIVSQIHRPFHTGTPTFGYIFGGYERSDNVWLDSNFASYEAKIHSSRMTDMKEEAARLSKGIPHVVAKRMYYRKKNRNKYYKENVSND